MRKEQLQKYKYLGLNIAYYRKERGISQSRLAERINVSRTHMSRIETADCAYPWTWSLPSATPWRCRRRSCLPSGYNRPSHETIVCGSTETQKTCAPHRGKRKDDETWKRLS